MNLNVLVVDDEPLARKEVKRLLTPFEGIQVIAEAENVDEAIDQLTQYPIDVVFLDIEMPGRKGTELAELILNQDVLVVFCTAYQNYAVDAFALNAIDYLLKPINPKRLNETVNKLQEVTKKTNKPLEELYHDASKFLVKMGETTKMLNLKDVYRFESIGNHTAIYSDIGKAFVVTSLSKIEDKLDQNTYFRVDRSNIIRLDDIIHIEENLDYSMTLTLPNDSVVSVSRRRTKQLKSLFSLA